MGRKMPRRPGLEDAVVGAPVYISGACANCDSLDVTVQAPLFCSQGCRQTAELVRYVRACPRNGRAQLTDVKEAIHTRLAMVLGGGYPERQRQVPPEVRAEVFKRADGRCENCGRSLDFGRTTSDPNAIPTIQHVLGNSSDLANLKAFCRRCNLGDAQARLVPVASGSAHERMAAELAVRWSSREPLRLCDDDEHWKSTWAQIARSARDVISKRSTIGRSPDPVTQESC